MRFALLVKLVRAKFENNRETAGALGARVSSFTCLAGMVLPWVRFGFACCSFCGGFPLQQYLLLLRCRSLGKGQDASKPRQMLVVRRGFQFFSDEFDSECLLREDFPEAFFSSLKRKKNKPEDCM